MRSRVLVLGAGFGGLELAATLSEALGAGADVTLIDRSDAFVFGYSKLDILFGNVDPADARVPYRSLGLPGVRFVHETITAIEPETRSVTTDGGTYHGDTLVVALGADYDLSATPGLAGSGSEFYSVEGATRLRDAVTGFSRGHVVIGVCGAPFKCPPAPSECALLLHDVLSERGVRDDCTISFVIPFPTPVPPSPDTSAALVDVFAERGIEFVPGRQVASLDAGRAVVVLDDGSERPCDLLLGVPKHCAPEVVVASGLADEGWIPVEPATLRTRYPGVYAVGDCALIGVPKAGVFAEGAARVVALSILADLDGGPQPGPYGGSGSCYIEFGGGQVGRVDVDFFSGPKPTGIFRAPVAEFVSQKRAFGAVRRARWFGPSPQSP